MKEVILKKISESELKPKLLILKAEGKQFDEKMLKMLQIAALNNLPLELTDEQAELLESVKMLESIKEKTPDVVSQGTPRTILAEVPQNSQNRVAEHGETNGKIENPEIVTEYGVQEPTELESAEGAQTGITEETLEEDAQEIKPVDDESVIDEQQKVDVVEGESVEQEIDANIKVNVDEQLTDESESPEEDKKEEINAMDAEAFAPNVDEANGMSVEQSRKMYYLTPERVFESFKRLNGGEIWNMFGRLQGGSQIQTAIEQAYKGCNWISNLMDPKFLDNILKENLPNNSQVLEMRNFHMAALLGTYVGYHIERNDAEVKDINASGDEKTDVKVIKLPMLVSEIPDSMKKEITGDLSAAITQRIAEIMDTSDQRRALKMLSPLKLVIDKVIADYSEGLHDTEKNNVIKAYISTIRGDMTDKMKRTIQDLNVSLDLYAVNWNDKEERQNIINMLGELQDDGRGADVSRFVEEINMSFNVNSVNDLRAVEAACKDLSQLSGQGIEVNIAFEIPVEQLGNVELQAGLEEIVNSYDNIERDYTTELSTNGLNVVMDQMVQGAIQANPAGGAINTAMNMMAPGRGGSGVIGMDPRQIAIAGLTHMATGMLGIDIEQLIEGPTRGPIMPTGGSGV